MTPQLLEEKKKEFEKIHNLANTGEELFDRTWDFLEALVEEVQREASHEGMKDTVRWSYLLSAKELTPEEQEEVEIVGARIARSNYLRLTNQQDKKE